jgi:prepilin-type processing-associated H-X9-DG protein
LSDEPNTNATSGAVIANQFTTLGYIPYILDQMELGNLLTVMKMKVSWADAPNYQFGLNTPLTDFRCPSFPDIQATFTAQPGANDTQEKTNLMTHYQGVMGARPTACPPTALTFPEKTYSLFATPGTDGCGDRNYASGYGTSANNGILFPASKINLKDVTDGSTHTFIVGEISWDSGPQRVWMAGGGSKTNMQTYVYTSKNIYWPLNTACRQAAESATWRPCPYANNDVSFGSLHPGGAHFLMCDGSVQFIRQDVQLAVLKSLASRKSAEVFESPF